MIPETIHSEAATSAAPAQHVPLVPTDSTRPDWIPQALFPYQSRFFQLPSGRLHYIDEGQGPTLLLLHGSPLWSFMYRDVIRTLRQRYRCIAVDLPGMGLSRAPVATGRAYSWNAEALERFVTQLDLSNITMVIHATAGPSAMAMAARHPDRISRIVVSNSFVWPLDKVPGLGRMVRIVSSSLFRFFVVKFNLLARITARKARRTGPFDEQERAAILGPYQQREAREHLGNLLYSLRTDHLFKHLQDDIAVLRRRPLLLLSGAHDNGYRAGLVDRWTAAFDNHNVVVFEDAGHFPIEDCPGKWTSALTRWLEKDSPRRCGELLAWG